VISSASISHKNSDALNSRVQYLPKNNYTARAHVRKCFTVYSNCTAVGHLKKLTHCCTAKKKVICLSERLSRRSCSLLCCGIGLVEPSKVCIAALYMYTIRNVFKTVQFPTMTLSLLLRILAFSFLHRFCTAKNGKYYYKQNCIYDGFDNQKAGGENEGVWLRYPDEVPESATLYGCQWGVKGGATYLQFSLRKKRLSGIHGKDKITVLLFPKWKCDYINTFTLDELSENPREVLYTLRDTDVSYASTEIRVALEISKSRDTSGCLVVYCLNPRLHCEYDLDAEFYQGCVSL